MRESARATAEFYNRYGVYPFEAGIKNKSGSPDDRDERFRLKDPYRNALEIMNQRQLMEGFQKRYDPNTPGLMHYFEQPPSESKAAGPSEQRVASAYQQNASTRQAAGISSNPQVKPDVDMSGAAAAASEAESLGQQIIRALSVSASPQIDTGPIQRALSLVLQLQRALAGISAAANQAHASVSREMNRNFADHGVSP